MSLLQKLLEKAGLSKEVQEKLSRIDSIMDFETYCEVVALFNEHDLNKLEPFAKVIILSRGLNALYNYRQDSLNTLSDNAISHTITLMNGIIEQINNASYEYGDINIADLNLLLWEIEVSIKGNIKNIKDSTLQVNTLEKNISNMQKDIKNQISKEKIPELEAHTTSIEIYRAKREALGMNIDYQNDKGSTRLNMIQVLDTMPVEMLLQYFKEISTSINKEMAEANELRFDMSRHKDERDQAEKNKNRVCNEFQEVFGQLVVRAVREKNNDLFKQVITIFQESIEDSRRSSLIQSVCRSLLSYFKNSGAEAEIFLDWLKEVDTELHQNCENIILDFFQQIEKLTRENSKIYLKAKCQHILDDVVIKNLYTSILNVIEESESSYDKVRGLFHIAKSYQKSLASDQFPSNVKEDLLHIINLYFDWDLHYQLVTQDEFVLIKNRLADLVSRHDIDHETLNRDCDIVAKITGYSSNEIHTILNLLREDPASPEEVKKLLNEIPEHSLMINQLGLKEIADQKISSYMTIRELVEDRNNAIQTLYKEYRQLSTATEKQYLIDLLANRVLRADAEALAKFARSGGKEQKEFVKLIEQELVKGESSEKGIDQWEYGTVNAAVLSQIYRLSSHCLMPFLTLSYDGQESLSDYLKKIDRSIWMKILDFIPGSVELSEQKYLKIGVGEIEPKSEEIGDLLKVHLDVPVEFPFPKKVLLNLHISFCLKNIDGKILVLSPAYQLDEKSIEHPKPWMRSFLPAAKVSSDLINIREENIDIAAQKLNYKTYLQSEIAKINKEISDIHSLPQKIENAQLDCAKAEGAQHVLKRLFAERNKELTRLKQKLQSLSQEEKNIGYHLAQEIAAIRRDIDTNNDMISSLKERIANYNEQIKIAQTTDKVRKLQTIIAEHEKEIQKVEREIPIKEQQLPKGCALYLLPAVEPIYRTHKLYHGLMSKPAIRPNAELIFNACEELVKEKFFEIKELSSRYGMALREKNYEEAARLVVENPSNFWQADYLYTLLDKIEHSQPTDKTIALLPGVHFATSYLGNPRASEERIILANKATDILIKHLNKQPRRSQERATISNEWIGLVSGPVKVKKLLSLNKNGKANLSSEQVTQLAEKSFNGKKGLIARVRGVSDYSLIKQALKQKTMSLSDILKVFEQACSKGASNDIKKKIAKAFKERFDMPEYASEKNEISKIAKFWSDDLYNDFIGRIKDKNERTAIHDLMYPVVEIKSSVEVLVEGKLELEEDDGKIYESPRPIPRKRLDKTPAPIAVPWHQPVEGEEIVSGAAAACDKVGIFHHDPREALLTPAVTVGDKGDKKDFTV